MYLRVNDLMTETAEATVLGDARCRRDEDGQRLAAAKPPDPAYLLGDALLSGRICRDDQERRKARVVALGLAAVPEPIVGAELRRIRPSPLGPPVVLEEEAVRDAVAHVGAIPIGLAAAPFAGGGPAPLGELIGATPTAHGLGGHGQGHEHGVRPQGVCQCSQQAPPPPCLASTRPGRGAGAAGSGAVPRPRGGTP